VNRGLMVTGEGWCRGAVTCGTFGATHLLTIFWQRRGGGGTCAACCAGVSGGDSSYKTQTRQGSARVVPVSTNVDIISANATAIPAFAALDVNVTAVSSSGNPCGNTRRLPGLLRYAGVDPLHEIFGCPAV
jgi:hypothetical protein